MNNLVQLRKQQPRVQRGHAPFCHWCEFRSYAGVYCHARGMTSCRDRNGEGQCNEYVGSAWTRLLQWQRLRPFVERGDRR